MLRVFDGSKQSRQQIGVRPALPLLSDAWLSSEGTGDGSRAAAGRLALLGSSGRTERPPGNGVMGAALLLSALSVGHIG